VGGGACQNYVSVIDAQRVQEIERIETSDGVSIVAFRPDGQVAFVESSRTPEVDAIEVATHRVLARIPVTSLFSPNILVSPDAWRCG
jgi:DNA-binding beta-propeller fold protein YncE